MSKAEIRKEVKSRVAKMTDIEKEWASNAIIDELISSKAFRSARNIFIYINMQDEPSTFDLIGLAMALEKVVCVPKLYSDGSIWRREHRTVNGSYLRRMQIKPYVAKTNTWLSASMIPKVREFRNTFTD